ncbi:MAG: O-antigen ligase family protein [Candidatus Daviesbacteria bacterium]|nr:O-antigen ligase family protein [Candidatus Daviesbacteria bacterium]
MLSFLSLILLFSIIAGQLIKIPLGSGGLTLLDITVLILDIYALTKIKYGSIKFPFWFKLILIFCFIGFISLLFSPLKLSLQQFLISISYNFRLLAYFSFGYFLTLNIFPSLKKDVFKILIYSGIILAILGILQFIFIPNLIFLQQYGWDPHYFRAVSTFLDPNFLGAFLGLTLLLILKNSQKLFSKKFQFIFFALVYICLLLTFSRSAILLLGVSLLTFSLLKKSIKLTILTFLLCIGFGISFYIYTQLVLIPKGINREESASFRISTWQDGLKIWQSSSIFGVGFNSYRYALIKLNPNSENFTNSHGASTNDSSLLYVLATTGIIGLVIYLFFLRSILWLPVLLGLIINSFFINSLFYPSILIWIILYVGTEGLSLLRHSSEILSRHKVGIEPPTSTI